MQAGEIVLISLFGSMGDLAFLARLAQELSHGGYPVTLIFNQWYLDNSKELLHRIKLKSIGLDRSSKFAYSRKDWNGRAQMVVDLFSATNKPRAIVGDISARHLAIPAKHNGIPFIVASPMPYIKTREFFLDSPYPCVGKMGWFNLFRWKLGRFPMQWWTRLARMVAPEPPKIVDPELRERYRSLFASEVTRGSGWDSIADSVTQFVSADPVIIPKCSDWNDNVHVLGSLSWDTAGWGPSDGLLRFLSAGAPPLYVGFGSSTALRFWGKKGATYLMQLAEAAKAKGVRMIFSSPFGVEHLKGLPENTFVTPLISHDWLFQECSAVMCHGGYGTVYAALKAQRPLVIFPHQSDNFYIAERMRQLGVAPRSNNKYLKFTVRDFCRQLDQLANRYASLKSNAEKVGEVIRRTNGSRNHFEKIRDIV
jgi:UDP:flavonoid glycosyltransferase YjiC (YdhE family)